MTALASSPLDAQPLGADVVSGDNHVLGRVGGFLVDNDDRTTHFVLELGRRRVAVPLGAVARIATGMVTLGLTTADVRRLPDVALGRRAVANTG